MFKLSTLTLFCLVASELFQCC